VATIYTIGHSRREWQELLDVLSGHRITRLADVRALPRSRWVPHFNRERMVQAFDKTGVEYRWMPELGGKRGKQREHSPNVALRDEALRNYADYMLSPEFQDAARTLVELAGTSKTAVMCAEKNFSNCHRSLISDYLTLHGHEVLHIEDLSPPQRHRLSADAHLFEGQVIYSPEDLFRDKLA